MQVVQLVVTIGVFVLGAELWWAAWGVSFLCFLLVCVCTMTGTPTSAGTLAAMKRLLVSSLHPFGRRC